MEGDLLLTTKTPKSWLNSAFGWENFARIFILIILIFLVPVWDVYYPGNDYFLGMVLTLALILLLLELLHFFPFYQIIAESNVIMLLAPSKTPLEDTKQRYQKLIDYIDGKFKAQQGIEVIQFSLIQNPEAVKVPQAIRYFLCYQADEQRGLTGISYWTPMRKKLTKKGVKIYLVIPPSSSAGDQKDRDEIEYHKTQQTLIETALI